MLLAQEQGMTRGEYVFIFFSNLPGEITLMGDYSWKRGDDRDKVGTQSIFQINFYWFIFDSRNKKK